MLVPIDCKSSLCLCPKRVLQEYKFTNWNWLLFREKVLLMWLKLTFHFFIEQESGIYFPNKTSTAASFLALTLLLCLNHEFLTQSSSFWLISSSFLLRFLLAFKPVRTLIYFFLFLCNFFLYLISFWSFKDILYVEHWRYFFSLFF